MTLIWTQEFGTGNWNLWAHDEDTNEMRCLLNDYSESVHDAPRGINVWVCEVVDPWRLFS